jgi:hypothetical protein
MRWYPWWTSVQKSTFPPRDENVLFHNTGSTGWGRRRNLGDYKGNKKEGDFSHLHDKFADPGDAA